MLKLFIGNKAYSSWSMRGWLAVKQSGLPFDEIVVPLYDEEWDRRREGDEFAPSSGKVPILWDEDGTRYGKGRGWFGPRWKVASGSASRKGRATATRQPAAANAWATRSRP